MIHYLDTSALVKRYVAEEGSAAVQSLFRMRTSLSTSRISFVEASSAFARRRREKKLTPARYASLCQRLARDLQAMMLVEPVPEVLEQAAALCGGHPLRAYDAIQLASALSLREHVDPEVHSVCADASLLAIAKRLGLVDAGFDR